MASVSSAVARNIATASTFTAPYRHWVLETVFPRNLALALDELSIDEARDMEFGGRRECNNSKRVFFDPAMQAASAAVAEAVAAFRDPEVVAAIEATCAVDLAGTFLRIEYCQDTDGFWLEPHTDIGAKRFTMMCYLSVGEGSDPCGTDMMDREGRVLGRAPFHLSAGFIFIPGSDTWHGFVPRRINGVRKSLMINYVGPEWRARHELSSGVPVK
ncbi:MAG: 2OG-Fe(II) oxygenase [Solirubrobacterales bacterium]